MATSTSPTPGSPPSTDVGPPGRPRWTGWTLPVALLAVAVAFGAGVVRVLSGVDESFRYGGDQALIGLAAHEASTLDRDLGPYSRYGWSHPGPLWFYLLAPFARLLGGDDAALIAANVLVNGVLAAAVVVAVHRAGRPALTLAATALVLAFVLRMPAAMFVDAWSPYALLMGTLLFLVLAARVHSGSWSALLAVLVAGSFLVQTHVGTAPLVVLVSATGGIAFVAARRAHRRTAASGADDPGAARARRPWPVVALSVLLVAVWIPPVVQQLSSPIRDGNVVRLTSFLLFNEEDGGRPSPFQALVAVGRLLAMPLYGWDTGPYEMDVSTLPAPVLLAFVAQLLASAALVVLGRRLASPSGLWWGVVTLVALTAAVASAATVTGLLYWYLIIWVAALPVATAIGYAHLALDRRGADRAVTPGRTSVTGRPPVLVALTVAVLAGSVAVAAALGGGVQDLPASPGVARASDVVDRALEDVDGRAVHVDIETLALWPIGAGVVHGLVSEDWDVSVDRDSEELFGAARVGSGDEPVDVILVSTDSPEHDRLRRDRGVTDLGPVDTEFGAASVLVRIDD